MKKVADQLLEHPLLISLFVIDLAILMFHKPPAIASLIMLAALIGISMFFGEKLSVFSSRTRESQSQPH